MRYKPAQTNGRRCLYPFAGDSMCIRKKRKRKAKADNGAKRLKEQAIIIICLWLVGQRILLYSYYIPRESRCNKRISSIFSIGTLNR
jgi:hypothetical protein